MKNISITIIIPAFNEERNIKNILSDLLLQKLPKHFVLKNIILTSDGSVDSTIKNAKSIKNAAIKIYDNKKQMGKGFRMNQVFRKINSDICICLDADIKLKSIRTIATLAQEMLDSNSDLISCNIKPLKPRTFFEKIIEYSVYYKKYIFENWKKGINIYTCHGPVLVYSRDLYKELVIPNIHAEDMYSYLACKKLNLKYHYCNNTEILYRLPDNFRDHLKQSSRFMRSAPQIYKHFTKESVLNETRIPMLDFLLLSIKSVLSSSNSYLLPFYFYVLIKVKISMNSMNETFQFWGAKSTKNI